MLLLKLTESSKNASPFTDKSSLICTLLFAYKVSCKDNEEDNNVFPPTDNVFSITRLLPYNELTDNIGVIIDSSTTKLLFAYIVSYTDNVDDNNVWPPTDNSSFIIRLLFAIILSLNVASLDTNKLFTLVFPSILTFELKYAFPPTDNCSLNITLLFAYKVFSKIVIPFTDK